MKILFVASEGVPFCKTGGLADVIGALPKALRQKRHDVRIILPKYKAIRAQEFGIKETGEFVRIPMGRGKVETADIRVAKTEKGIPVYFINHEGYFGRPGLYRGPSGDYPDNGERFTFFCKAVLDACKAIQFRPDIIHCHDWQTGLIPMYLKVLLKGDAFFQHTASIFTIHNIAYQGLFPKTLLEATGFSWNEFTLDQFEFYDHISFMKAALMNADRLTTVSPTYAQEIQNSYEFGQGLEGVLRDHASHLTGIVNGLDPDDWNPAKDPFLAAPFDSDHLESRRECKAALQISLKFSVDPSIPLLGIVARFNRQKGVDLLTQIIPDLMNRYNVQIAVLGQGEEDLQREFDRDSGQYPGHIRICTDFNEPLAHHIYGGSDLFLMPSRFEPCGLSQMIAMRYGSIPVVANTGGLHDTVMQAGSASGTGFLFQTGSAPAFLGAVEQALAMIRNAEAWTALQRRAMHEDFTWTTSVSAYLEVYRQALGRRSKSSGRPRSQSPKPR